MKSLPYLAASVVGGVLFVACRSSDEHTTTDRPVARDNQKADSAQEDPLGPNAACYVCHMTFVGEELTKTHVHEKIGCTECHGVSAGHANDEDIGATPPDKLYQRDQVNAFCRTCHAKHDVAPERLISTWSERRQSRWVTDALKPAAVCTDCHGEHRIAG